MYYIYLYNLSHHDNILYHIQNKNVQLYDCKDVDVTVWTTEDKAG
jgi:chloramphenicol O-acetyltransferase